MDLNESILVAMMFVMVLSIGIATILGAIAAVASKRTSIAVNWMAASWPLLLLLAHLDLFWHTLTLVQIETWSFSGFLFVLCGPVLLFLATSFLLGEPERLVSVGLLTHYFGVSRDMFVLLALVEAWLCGIDVMLGHGITASSGWNLAALVVFAALAASKSRRLHESGTLLTWLLFALPLILRGVGAQP